MNFYSVTSFLIKFKVLLLIAMMINLCAAVAPASADTLQSIRETGVIRIAHRDSSLPFSYLDDSGKPQGFSVDLCNKFVEHLREQMKLPQLRIEWMKVTATQRMQVVKDKQADMECGSTTNNAERRQTYLFTMPTFIAGIKIMSRSELPVYNLIGLAKKKATASAGSTAAKLLQAGKKDGIPIEIIEANDHLDAWKMLESGKVDAWLTDDVILAAYRSKAPKPDFYVISNRFLTVEPYGFVFRKDDGALVDMLDQEIVRIMRSGEFKSLYDRWFLKPLPGSNNSLRLEMNELLRSQMTHPSRALPTNY